VDLEVRGRPTAATHAGVAITLEDGGAEDLGDVAAVVGDLRDVDAVGEHDLDESAGPDGPDGL
jgi:hypothetical protein